MKKISIFLLAAAALAGIGCDDNVPEPGTLDVPVQSVTLDESLSGGVTLEVGQTLDVALKVHVEPYNATDLAELFYSSNVEVATVSPKGIVTAQKAGITMISIYVGGIETYFTVTVVDQIPVDIESIAFTAESREMTLGEADLDLASMLSILPLDQNEGVDFASSQPDVATVSADGRLHALKVGRTTVTATAKRHAELSASIEIQVIRLVNEDSDRSNWSMSFSKPYYNDTAIGSSATAAIDNNTSTTLSMVRPGRTFNGVSGGAATDEIWFQIDRGENPGTVNYLRIKHRPEGGGSNNILVRWFGFNRIEGSDNADFSNAEVIVNNVSLTPDPSVYDNLETDNILIPETGHRYLRFIGANNAGDTKGFYCSPSPGSTIQINEFYLGLQTKITEE